VGHVLQFCFPQVEKCSRVSSEKCEIEGVLLDMEMVIRYMKETNTKGVTEIVYRFAVTVSGQLIYL